jgi:hypothetical protein
LGTAADLDDLCVPCSDLCGGTVKQCTRPQDPTACAACKDRRFQGRCYRVCPPEVPFFTTPSGECVAQCPSNRPFFNDTRYEPGFVDSVCVVACAALGDPARVFTSPANPMRCTTEIQASRDGQATEEDTLGAAALVAICVCPLLVVALVVAIAVNRRKKVGSMDVSSGKGAQRSQPSYTMNQVYEPRLSPGLAAAGDEDADAAYTFDSPYGHGASPYASF